MKKITEEERRALNREKARLYYYSHHEEVLRKKRERMRKKKEGKAWRQRKSKKDAIAEYQAHAFDRERGHRPVDMEKVKSLFKSPTAAGHLQWLVDRRKREMIKNEKLKDGNNE